MEEDARPGTERQVPRLNGARPELWSLTQASVAVAAAIIRSRPAGMSGREFAEALACKLRSQDEGWKEKAQRLQQEVLRLRQELLVTRLTSVTQGSQETAGHDSAVENTSQDLFGSADSETPELLEQDIQPVTSVPQPAAACTDHRRPDRDALDRHVKFLQSLCALHRVEENRRGLEALWFSPDGGAGSVLTDSVCHLLDSVVAACRGPPPPGPGDLVLQACQVTARAMELFCSRRLPSVELTRCVEESLRELTGMLLHSHQPSGLPAAEKLTEYLVTLGSSSVSTSFLIRHILSQISGVADQLWQLLQGQESDPLDTFPVDQYQNSCSLFWILEELLRKSSAPCRAELQSETTSFLRQLEQRVFLLSDEFPLFSIYMWRIGGLLTSCDT